MIHKTIHRKLILNLGWHREVLNAWLPLCYLNILLNRKQLPYITKRHVTTLAAIVEWRRYKIRRIKMIRGNLYVKKCKYIFLGVLFALITKWTLKKYSANIRINYVVSSSQPKAWDNHYILLCIYNKYDILFCSWYYFLLLIIIISANRLLKTYI
jgi:hypothetical protein